MVKKEAKAVSINATDLRYIIDNLIDGVWVIDIDYSIIEINETAKSTFFPQIKADVFSGFSALDGFSEYERQIWAELYERCLSGEELSVEIKLTQKIKHTYSIALNPIEINGKITGAVVTAKDISIFKATRERLHKLYREHKFVSELMQDIYRTKDWKSVLSSILEKVSNLMSVTCAYLRLTNMDENQLPNTYVIRYDNAKKHCKCLDILADKLIDKMHEHIYLAYNNKQDIIKNLEIAPDYQQAQAMFVYPIRMMDKIIGFLGFADCLHAKRWQGDELIFISTISEIITSYIVQQISQENMSNSYKITRNVMDNLNAIVTVTDIKTYKVIFANKFAIDKFGEIEGKICWTIAKKDAEKPCDNCEIAELLQMDENAVLYTEVQNEVNSSWYHTANSLINWIDGRKAHLQIAVDISDRIEMENTLRKTADELLETNKTKDKFFSIIAHDLKNPFLSLMGFSELLANKSHELSISEIEEFSSLIHESARNAHQLLQNLLVWSQSQTGKLKFQPQELNLTLLADNCLESVKLLANQKQIFLHKEYQAIPIMVADVNMVTTIIRNLLTNAVKFTNECGTVTLKLDNDKEDIIITIEDTGVGMTNDEVSKLFRVDVSNKSIGNASSSAKGTGLGLILCKEFVQKHGGTISVNSETGKGSRFIVRLPQKTTGILD